MRFEIGKPGNDPTMPDVVLAIDGEEYPLAFDHAAIAMVGKLTGLNLLLEAVDQPTFEGVTALFFAAAKPARPSLTLEDAQKLVDLRNVFKVLEAVRYAWGASKSEPKALPEGESTAQESGPKA